MKKNQHKLFYVNKNKNNCVSCELNDRPVLIFDVFCDTPSYIFKTINFNFSEKEIFKLYNNFGINFLIYQMIQNKNMSKEEAIKQSVNYFIEFLILQYS